MFKPIKTPGRIANQTTSNKTKKKSPLIAKVNSDIKANSKPKSKPNQNKRGY